MRKSAIFSERGLPRHRADVSPRDFFFTSRRVVFQNVSVTFFIYERGHSINIRCPSGLRNTCRLPEVIRSPFSSLFSFFSCKFLIESLRVPDFHTCFGFRPFSAIAPSAITTPVLYLQCPASFEKEAAALDIPAFPVRYFREAASENGRKEGHVPLLRRYGTRTSLTRISKMHR